MRLTILSVAYPLAPVGPDAAGGAEQVLGILDQGLAQAGHHSIVVGCEGSEVRGTLVATRRVEGRLDEQARQCAQQEHRAAIDDALRRWPVDLVHMHGLDFARYLPASGIPVLATLHLPPSWYAPQIFHLERPRTYLNCVSSSQRRACPQDARLLPEIENGVRIDCFATHVRKRDYVLAIGRICPEKGFHIAIDAAARARKLCILAGQVFPYEAHQRYFREQIAPRLNHMCRFAGQVKFERKRRLLAGARCLLVPSLVEETSSLVAMEALACGTPVIAFRAGALAEIVEHGRTGFLVSNAIEMAEAIHAAATLDPAECRRAARERFRADRMVERYLEIYRQLV